MSVLEVREQLVDVVQLTARLPCACVVIGSRGCLACRAAHVLADIRAYGLRVKRWRNDLGAITVWELHRAGEIVVVRTPRPSAPRYISERWQDCAECGQRLVTGRWALFYDVDDLVARLPSQHGFPGTTVLSRGMPGEVPCWLPVARKPVHRDVSADTPDNGDSRPGPGGRLPDMRYVGYLRVSTEGQAADGLGLQVQEDEIRAWARRGRHKLVEVAVDAGRSGVADVGDRPGLAHALAVVLADGAEGIVVHRLDRLARDVVLQETILADLHRVGAHLHSTSAAEDEHLVDDPQDPTRALVRRILGAVAAYERDLIKLRLRAGRDRKSAAGGYSHGRPPFGWKADHGRLVPHEANQTTLALILELRHTGLSTRAIAAQLEARAIPSPTGGMRWRPDTIGSIAKRSGHSVSGPSKMTPIREKEPA